MSRRVNRSKTTEKERCRLMGALLDRASRFHDLSRRQLAQQLGVSVSTVNNYYQGHVDPLHCRLVIQQRLADLNGSTIDEVARFYTSGDWHVIGLKDPTLAKSTCRGLRRNKERRPVLRQPSDEPSPLLMAGIRWKMRQVREAKAAAAEAAAQAVMGKDPVTESTGAIADEAN